MSGEAIAASESRGQSLETVPEPRRQPHLKVAIASLPVVAYVLVAVFGPLVVPYNYVTVRLQDRLLPPLTVLSSGGRAWFGTDQLGRDMLAQVIQGARVSILVGVVTVLVAGAVGVTLGLLSGYVGGWLDSIVMRVADVQLAFPSILLAILITAVLGPSVVNVILSLAITRWVIFARVTRASTLTLREREYVDASRVLGVSRWRILWSDIAPGALNPILVLATLEFGLVIVAEASLSYLGLGTPESMPSWGLTMADGQNYLATAWWIATIPGIALALLVVSVGRLGDRLRSLLGEER